MGFGAIGLTPVRVDSGTKDTLTVGNDGSVPITLSSGHVLDRRERVTVPVFDEVEVTAVAAVASGGHAWWEESGGAPGDAGGTITVTPLGDSATVTFTTDGAVYSDQELENEVTSATITDTTVYYLSGALTVTVSWSGGSTEVSVASTGTATVEVPAETAAADQHGEAYAATAGIRATLLRGAQSTTILALGDSTGDAATEWIYKLGQLLGDAHPDYSVNYRLYGPDGSTEAWGGVTQIQAGTAGGDRGIKPASGNPLYFANANAYTGDFGYRLLISPSGGWAPGGSAAVRNIISRGVDSSSNRHSKFGLDESGKLVWEWSAAGTSYATAVVSTVAVPFTGTAWGWVRVDFDVDNGASGNTATFYTSTDGFTWTQLGDAVVTATATTLSGSTQRFQLGEYGSVAGTRYSDMFYGWVDVRNNTLSASTWQQVAPSLPQNWLYTHTGTLPTVTGAPVLWILNASRAGQGISWFNDSNRRVKLHAENGQQLVIASDGHNEQAEVGSSFVTTYGGWVDDMRNRTKYTPMVLICQNPGFINGGALDLDELAGTPNANRQRTIAAIAAGTPGCYPLDFWPVFNATDLDTDVPDNLHPAEGAQTRMAQHAYDELFA